MIRQLTLEELVCLASVLGLDLAIRTYPAGDAIRDRAHARLLERFRSRLNPTLRWRTEVPLRNPGDRRAWDGMVSGRGWQEPVEAETVIDDTQALERRLALKLRDGGFEHLILVVADTRRNRDAVDAAPAAFERFTVAARNVLAALADGRDPGGSGIVFL